MIGGDINRLVGPGELDDEARALIFARRFGPDFARETLHNLLGDIETEASALDVDLAGVVGADEFLEEFLDRLRRQANAVVDLYSA